MLKRWVSALDSTRPDGQHGYSWLWSAPARHSTRQIAEMLERTAFLTALGIDQHMVDLNDVLVRRYAQRMGHPAALDQRPLKEPARTVEMAGFLRYCLLTATDQLILLFQRRVADLWRHCASGVTRAVDWAQQYQQLLQELADLAAQEMVPDAELRSCLVDLVAAKRAQRAPSRASIIRQHRPTQAASSHRCLHAFALVSTQWPPQEGRAHRRLINSNDRDTGHQRHDFQMPARGEPQACRILHA